MHKDTRRRLKYIFYIAAMALTFMAVVYMNFRREAKLEQVQTRLVLFQQMLESDVRFQKVTVSIDKELSSTSLGGTINSREDLQALVEIISKTPPLPGTHNWRYGEIEVLRKNPKGPQVAQ